MKEIKRLSHLDLIQKFGLDIESRDFIYKPRETTPNKHSEPERSEMYSLGIVLTGTALLKVGLENYNVQAPGIVAVSPDQIRQWIDCQDDFSMASLFFSEDFAVSGLSDTLFLKKMKLFKNESNHFIPLNPEEAASIKILFDHIKEKKTSNLPNKLNVIQSLIRVVLLETESLLQIQHATHSDKYSQAYQLTSKFKELLFINFSKQREVNYYAEILCVTPKYLSRVLKEQTGKTAGELIDEIVCLEAKVLLQTNNMNVSQIADVLNFANPSFFGKFFKRHTGMSPVEYRKSLS